MNDIIKQNSQQMTLLDVLKNSEFKKELYAFCQSFAKSDMCPANLKGKPEECFIVSVKGLKLGLDVFDSCQYISVINGRPSVWGDGGMSIGMRHPNFARYEYKESGTLEQENYQCEIIIYKKDGTSQNEIFTYADYTREKLKLKAIWETHTKKMFWRRAIRNALVKNFSDAYAGVVYYEYEELGDIEDSKSKTKFQQSKTTPIVDIEGGVIFDKPQKTAEQIQQEIEDRNKAEIEKINNQTQTLMI